MKSNGRRKNSSHTSSATTAGAGEPTEGDLRLRSAITESTEKTASAAQITEKLTACARVNGSPKANTASRSWQVGDTYWMNPIVDSFSRRAAPANISSGRAVTGPARASRPWVVGES